MDNDTERHSKGALGWVHVIGWQIVALTLVIFIGISMYRICSSWAKESEIRAQTMSDVAPMVQSIAKLSEFISDCLPEGSKGNIKKLTTDATDLLVRELQREIDLEKARRLQAGN